MAPILSLWSTAIALSAQSTVQPQSWLQQTTATGSPITPLTSASRAGQNLAGSASTTISQTTAAALTPPSSLTIASPPAVPTTSPTSAVSQSTNSCSDGFVPCAKPGEVVCAGDAQFGICAANGCALLQNTANGVNCSTFKDFVSVIAILASPRQAQSSSAVLNGAESASPSMSTTVSVTGSISASIFTSTSALSASTISQSSSATPSATSLLTQTTSSGTIPMIPSSAVPPIKKLSPSATISVVSSSPTSPSTDNATSSVDYQLYTGDGTDFPNMNDWVSSFEDMWTSNHDNLISKICGQFGPNSDDESATLKSAVQAAADGSKLDPRFVLALVMQESHGCVRINPTMGAHMNPGLLQDYEGASNCNVDGVMKTPCPDTEIQGMIDDGVFGNTAPGNAQGAGLMQDYDAAGSQSPVSDAARYYITARIYNSGSYVNNDLGCGVATHCYASDVANRLVGWTGAESPCDIPEVTAGCTSGTPVVVKLFSGLFNLPDTDRS